MAPQRNLGDSNQTPSILGIWRLGSVLHSSRSISLTLAQPADAVGSPRWDYVLKAAIRNEPESRRQISQFVSAAAGVAHPNVIAVLDASVTASTPYLVMPHLDGETLAAQLSAGTKPLPVTLWLVRQVAQGLEALHRGGWVHGDVKPENIIVGTRGHATLIDLGFASRVHAIPNHIYRGTPDYSAPEALAGQMAIMPFMDVFSLGRVLQQFMQIAPPTPTFLMEPVRDLANSMTHEDPLQRPSATHVIKQLLRMEIESLGNHLGPTCRTKAA